MKKYFALLVGGLAMMLFASSASANFLPCANVASALGSTPFASGTATLTCSGFSIPALNTLTSIDIRIQNDATNSQTGSSAVTWTWTNPASLGGAVSTETETSNGISGFNPCVQVGSGAGTLNCASVTGTNFTSGFTPVSGGGPVGALSFTVSAAATGSDGTGVAPAGIVNGNEGGGSDNAHLFIQFNETAPAPEPATLVMAGGSLIGLALLARKRRKA